MLCGSGRTAHCGKRRGVVDTSVVWGSLCFGAVIGWITYYTMRKNTKPRTLSDLTVIIAALVGPAILTVFPAPVAATRQTMFGYYGIGLAFGFFLYYILFLILAWAAPAEVLLSMGLVQQRELGGGEASGDAGMRVLRPEAGIMDQGSDEPFVELR
jgi:hypothetical protein